MKSQDIREKMFTKNLISENEHKKWFELIKNSRPQYIQWWLSLLNNVSLFKVGVNEE